MRHCVWTILISACLLLAGCSNLSNYAGVEAFPKADFGNLDKGVVVVSTAAPQKCFTAATYLRVFRSHDNKLVDGAFSIPVDAFPLKSDFTHQFGFVNAFSLPEGKYHFRPWLAQPYLRAIQIPTLEFDVKAGETVYIGEVFMPQWCGASTRFVIGDHYHRDTAFAIARNPGFAQRPVAKRLLQFGEPIIIGD